MALYAAYASNMDPDQMAERAPHSPLRTTGWLQDWRLTFGGENVGFEGALATVVEAAGEHVFVVLYDVPEFDEQALDEWEGAAARAVPSVPWPLAWAPSSVPSTAAPVIVVTAATMARPRPPRIALSFMCPLLLVACRALAQVRRG